MATSRLAKSELFLFALLGLHTVDHAVNQPSRELPGGSGVVGLVGFAIVAVAIVFALRRGRLAAPVGLGAGLGTLAGFAIVHLPGVGRLADPYLDFSPNAVSWLLLAAPIVASVVVAACAASDLRGAGRDARARRGSVAAALPGEQPQRVG